MGGGKLDIRTTIEKRLQCNQCSNIQTIRRKLGKNQKQGHIKHLYCIRCQIRTAHIELGVT